jgi:hypothetical protein
MRIGLQTWGTDGDFMPFLALSIGLKQAGHQVTLAYTSVDGKSYSSLSETHGIELIEANGGISARTDVNPYAIAAKPGSFREYSTLLKLYFDPFAEAMYSASEKLCRENDLPEIPLSAHSVGADPFGSAIQVHVPLGNRPRNHHQCLDVVDGR